MFWAFDILRSPMKSDKCKSFLVYLSAFAILIVTLPVFAGDSTLDVKCVDVSGNPIQKVKVEIFNLANQKKKDKNSDSQGRAEFTKLDEGIYRVWGRKDGFTPGLYEFVVLKESSESVTLELTPGADKKFYFEDQAISQKAFQLMKQGLDMYKQAKYADAETLLSQSIELDPSNPEALYYFAVALLQLSKFDQSVKLLNQTSKIARAFMVLPPQPGQTGPNPYAQIEESVQQLLKKMPAIKAEIALNQQKYDVAVAEFAEALKMEPNNPQYLANMAIALTNSKKFDEALSYIEKAIQANPGEKDYTELKEKIIARKENAQIEQAQAIMNEGNKLLESGDAAAAIEKFEEAKSMVPEDTQAPLWRQVARAQAKLNQPDAAVEAFKRAMQLAPAEDIASYRNVFAQYYLDEKKYDQAIDVLVDPKASESQSVEEVLLSLVESSKDNNPALAEAALERVIKTNPQNADAYFELGRMYYADGKEKDSRSKELLQKFVEIGKDEQKVSSANDLLIMIERRSK